MSWVNRAQLILNDYEIVRDKPLYRSIVLHIRQKIRGNADLALCSYSVPDDDWAEVKRVLALHYADKRDVRTLEYQLSQLTQGNKSLEEFYMEVNSQFSLIINKLKSGGHPPNVVSALIETYRDKALDVFVRGLEADVSKLLVIRSPKNLPEAYSFCLELQNVNFRGRSVRPTYTPSFNHPAQQYRSSVVPRFPSAQPPIRAPMIAAQNDSSGRNWQGYQGPRQAIKMESNRSGQSYQSGLNARREEDTASKRSPSTSANPFGKAQRLYHMTIVGPPSTIIAEDTHPEAFYGEGCEHNDGSDQQVFLGEQNQGVIVEEQPNAEEVTNFMTDTSLAYHT